MKAMEPLGLKRWRVSLAHILRSPASPLAAGAAIALLCILYPPWFGCNKEGEDFCIAYGYAFARWQRPPFADAGIDFDDLRWELFSTAALTAAGVACVLAARGRNPTGRARNRIPANELAWLVEQLRAPDWRARRDILPALTQRLDQACGEDFAALDIEERRVLYRAAAHGWLESDTGFRAAAMRAAERFGDLLALPYVRNVALRHAGSADDVAVAARRCRDSLVALERTRSAERLLLRPSSETSLSCDTLPRITSESVGSEELLRPG